MREHQEALSVAEPPMPVEDRAYDVWEPLVAVAELAGNGWPDRARLACLALTGESDADADSAAERLLSDLYEVWGDAEHLFTSTVLERLHKLDEAPWADWYGKELTDRGLAKLLKPYGVRSKNVRIGEQQGRVTAAPTCPTRGGGTSQASQRPKTTKPQVSAGTDAGRTTLLQASRALTCTNSAVGTLGRTGRTTLAEPAKGRLDSRTCPAAAHPAGSTLRPKGTAPAAQSTWRQ
ncbi:MAG: DUF3631 domain-containing protein [Nocardioidaceae bacterium]